MTWHRSNLSNKDFFYDEHIRDTAIPGAPFPPHVESLRQSMLDFACQTLASTSGEDVDTQHRARNISQGGYSERYWEDFFRERFFDPLVQSTLVSHMDTRRVSRCNYYYDAIVRDSDALWSLFDGSPNDTDNSARLDFDGVKVPKPDYVFYLPMYHLGSSSHIPGIVDPKAREWHKSPNASLVDPFSWSVLEELFTHGLRPTPFKTFQKVQKEQREPREADLKCYPWLVVEYKKEKYSENDVRKLEEIVCCQAANATACAIKLNQIASRYSVEQTEDAQIPPIPAITTVGSRVKVWITYFAQDFQAPYFELYSQVVRWKAVNQGYVMRCIWKGDMTNINDIIKFRLVLDNTYTWATRVYKPLISSYIDQWRLVHCHAGIDSADMAMLRRQQTMEHSQKAMPLIRSILDRHSSIELDDSKHSQLTPLLMGLLIQQICAVERQALTTDMERIISEKIVSMNLGSRMTPLDEPERDTCRKRTENIHSASHQSPTPTVDNDDPADHDYVVSPATTTESQDDNPSELRRSIRTMPVVPPPVQSSPPGQVPGTPGGNPGLSATPSPAPDVSSRPLRGILHLTIAPNINPMVQSMPTKATPEPQSGPSSCGKDAGTKNEKSWARHEAHSPASTSSSWTDSTDGGSAQNQPSDPSPSRKPSVSTSSEPSGSILFPSNEDKWPRGKLFGLPSEYPRLSDHPPFRSSGFEWRPSEQNLEAFKGFYNPFAKLGNKGGADTKGSDGEESDQEPKRHS